MASASATRGIDPGRSRTGPARWPSPPGYVCRPDPRTPAGTLRQLWEYRRLVYIFIWRDLKVRYKHTVVGAAWNVIQPVGLMLVFTLVFGVLFQGRTGDTPFAVFLYPALLLWQFFSRAVTQGGTSIQGFHALLNKIYFPRIVAPVAYVLSALVDLAIASSALFVLMALYDTWPDWNVIFAPLFIGWTLLLALGLATLLAAVDSDYRDVRHTLPFLMQLWMFSSPIVYPITQVPDRWQWVYALNPMVALVQGFRWSLTPGSPAPTAWMLIAAFAFTGVSLWLAIHYFNLREGTLVDTV